jgi:indole-3-pyruvate monooxygenase
VIVGAGPAGLAVAACLRAAGRPFVVLDRNDAVASSWRSRYRRLHLHTAKEYSALPLLPFPREYPRYPSRDQVVEYLDLYARHFEIQPRLGEKVLSARRGDDGRWTVTTLRGQHRCGQVVVCTGHSAVPFRPQWPGEQSFGGEILHSASYLSGERFAGKRVLVVGLGNSGGEIAIDLVEHGARVDLAVRGGINVVPRDLLGMPIQRSTILLSVFPVWLRDAVARLVSRLAFGDLRRVGLSRPADGPVSQIVRRRRIPLIDVGTIALLRQGRIGVRPDISALEPGAVRFSDGAVEPFDAIVAATGYRPGAAALLPDHPEAVDGNGHPPAVSHPRLGGLFFVGFRTPPTGLLRQIAIDARAVARMIVAG